MRPSAEVKAFEVVSIQDIQPGADTHSISKSSSSSYK